MQCKGLLTSQTFNCQVVKRPASVLAHVPCSLEHDCLIDWLIYCGGEWKSECVSEWELAIDKVYIQQLPDIILYEHMVSSNLPPCYHGYKEKGYSRWLNGNSELLILSIASLLALLYCWKCLVLCIYNVVSGICDETYIGQGVQQTTFTVDVSIGWRLPLYIVTYKAWGMCYIADNMWSLF